MKFLEVMTELESLQDLISIRAMQILIICFFAMLICQILKFSIIKKLHWQLLISTGGFPSSHTALCVSLCIALGMFQWHDLEGKLDWSFAVAVVISVIVVHCIMMVFAKRDPQLGQIVSAKIQLLKKRIPRRLAA